MSTYYGPVETNNDGVLNKIVHQGFDEMPSVDSAKNMTLTEKFKGPTTLVSKIPFSPDFKIGKQRPTATIENGSVFVTRISAPNPGDNAWWKITDIRIEEAEAGDHATAIISYVRTTGKITSDDGEDDEDADEIDDVWELQHQENEASIYVYCCQETALSVNNARWLEAWRNPENSTLDYEEYKFEDKELGKAGKLTDAGKAIANHIMRGTEVIKTYNPIIIRTRYYTKGTIKDMGENLCRIDTPDKRKCPWRRTLLKQWDWLKISDDLTIEYADGTVKKQTRVERWIGSNTKWPPEFYSPDPKKRWKTQLSAEIEYEKTNEWNS